MSSNSHVRKECDYCRNYGQCSDVSFVAGHKCYVGCMGDGWRRPDHHVHKLCRKCNFLIKSKQKKAAKRLGEKLDNEKKEREKKAEIYHKAEVVTFYKLGREGMNEIFKNNRREFFNKLNKNEITRLQPHHNHFCERCSVSLSDNQAMVFGDGPLNAVVECKPCFRKVAIKLQSHTEILYEEIDKINNQYRES